MKIFGSTDSRLSDFSSDEAFFSALQRTQNDDGYWLSPEEKKEMRVHIPSDPDNLLQLKIRFADMVRGCMLPYEFPDEEHNTLVREVPDETLDRIAQITAYVQDFSKIDNLLCRLAFSTFCEQEDIYIDRIVLSELVQKYSQERERQNIISNQKLPPLHLDVIIENQEIYFHDIIRQLENNDKINRYSECYRQEHYEHGASEHARKFVQNAFGDIYTIGEYLEQERRVLLQVQKNITSWPKSQLRYIILWMKELRDLVNNMIAEKIPNEINKEYLDALVMSDFMVDPRTLL